MLVKYTYGAFTARMESGPGNNSDEVFRVNIECKIGGQEPELPSKDVEQEWDFLLIPNTIEVDGEYIHVWFDNNEKLQHLQIKLEGDTGVVIDVFDEDGELVKEIGCYDMMDFYF